MAPPISKAGRNMQSIARSNRRAVLKLVLSSGLQGIGSKEICAALGLCIDATQKHLAALVKSGKIERTCNAGMYVKWGVIGCRAHFEKQYTARARSDGPVYMRQRRAAESERIAAEFCARPFVHRVVDAKAAQINKPGPSSVWEFARGWGDRT